MESVKKLIDERAQHKREYDNRDTSSGSGNDAHADDADIRPIYNEETMAEVQLTTECNVFATGQQRAEQPEFNNEGEVDQNAQQYHDKCPLHTKFTDNQTTELSNQSLESENISKTIEHTTSLIAQNVEFKAQLQEKGFAIAALKNKLRKLTGNSVNTKFAKPSILRKPVLQPHRNQSVVRQPTAFKFERPIIDVNNDLSKPVTTHNSVNTKFAKPSILGKPVLQPHRNQSVVRQPTAFKSERPKISKPRFASQVDVNNDDLSKPVTTHYLPKRREFAKPHNMIATSSSRYSSNDIVHNHYLEEAKKKTQEHSRNSRNFSDSKHFVCSTCQKCVFNANHDSCVTKFLKEVNSRAKVPSNKTTNRNKPVEQIRVATKPNRQIPTGHRFSIKRTSTVHEKTTSPRSCLRWQPTGRILKTVCLRWVPTGKIFTSSTTKVDSEPPNGSKEDITNQCESEQALDVSAGTLLSTADQASVFMAMMSDHNSSDLVPQRQEMSVENVSSGLVPQGQKASDYDNSDPMPPRQNVVPTVEKTVSSQQGLEFLFSPLLEEYYNPAIGHAEDNNDDQAPNASFQEDEFINPFCTQNIKEEMADSAWIEAMQDDLGHYGLTVVNTEKW
ncbi:hypothetical protein Tco_0565027 [Tanacetum coccineum]